MLNKINMANDVEEAVDHIGGGSYDLVDSGVYQAEIKNAYMVTSKNGAIGVVLETELENGTNYTETIYCTNTKGDAFFVKDGRKIPMPGFTTINNICLLLTEKDLFNQDTPDKVVSIYDFESSKDVNREVPVLVDLIGGVVAFAIQRVRENKTKKNDSTGKYEPINEAREINNIKSVYHPELKLTVYEAMNEREATHWDAWAEKNTGVTWDKYKEVTGGARQGSPSRAAAGGTDAPARTSMFKKK